VKVYRPRCDEDAERGDAKRTGSVHGPALALRDREAARHVSHRRADDQIPVRGGGVSAERDRAVVWVGAAACAICCAGPVLGFLAAVGLGTAAGFALFGLAGLAIALALGPLLYIRRRRRRSTCAPRSGMVRVEPPGMRISR
jgi:hypothetical protein